MPESNRSTAVLLTPGEFKLRVQAYFKGEVLRNAGFVALMCAAVSFFLLFGRWVDRVGFDARHILIAVTSSLAVFAFLFYFLVRRPRRRLRKFGLLCPHCQKPLAGFPSQVVLTTGKCGHYGNPVLED